MKWPKELVLIRHAESAYNDLRRQKADDPSYQECMRALKDVPESPLTRELAVAMKAKYQLVEGDWNTPLTREGIIQATKTAGKLSESAELPDMIFISPYLRTQDTHRIFCDSWPALSRVPHVAEERIREQEHGLALLYNDRRLFFFFHPEQEELHCRQGPYWYQYPQGEAVPDVRARIHDWYSTLIREFSGARVWAFTHHLSILSVWANLERWGHEKFLEMDHHRKPINCGLTSFVGNPCLGREGKLVLDTYNQCLYE